MDAEVKLDQEFPSPYGVSFILTLNQHICTVKYGHMFPSPYGVIFILTLNKDLAQFQNEFPSPYGVIFILTYLFEKALNKLSKGRVSVSLRSYIHSYMKK